LPISNKVKFSADNNITEFPAIGKVDILPICLPIYSDFFKLPLASASGQQIKMPSALAKLLEIASNGFSLIYAKAKRMIIFKQKFG
jgi:hypothetical protein